MAISRAISEISVEMRPWASDDLHRAIMMQQQEEYTELVANITGQPPPIPKSCDDDGKAKNTGGHTRDFRRKAQAAKDHPAEEPGKILCVKVEITKSSHYTAPCAARFIKFQADSNVLSEIGETVRTSDRHEHAFGVTDS